MDKVVTALERQLKKEQERVFKKDPKADEQYVDELQQAIDVLRFFTTAMNLLKG